MKGREAGRKDDHVAICRDRDVEPSAGVFSGWELEATALPEIDLAEVSLETTFLGQSFAAPLLIAGMTGGARHAERINAVLAEAARRRRVPLGLGSLKILLSHPEFRSHFDLAGDDLFVLGNFGAADLGRAVPLDAVRRWASELRLGAVALHLNAVQECVQPEGNPSFTGVLRQIEACVRTAGVPIVVKEVGAGVTAQDYRRLRECGVAAVDVGGRGGTSWSLVEGLRSQGLSARLGSLFSRWGLSTPEAVVACHAVRVEDGGPVLVATGGIRDGIQMAVCLALGADMCGVALPLLRAAERGTDALEEVLDELEFFERSLRVAMFCCGCTTPRELAGRIRRRS